MTTYGPSSAAGARLDVELVARVTARRGVGQLASGLMAPCVLWLLFALGMFVARPQEALNLVWLLVGLHALDVGCAAMALRGARGLAHHPAVAGRMGTWLVRLAEVAVVASAGLAVTMLLPLLPLHWFQPRLLVLASFGLHLLRGAFWGIVLFACGRVARSHRSALQKAAIACSLCAPFSLVGYGLAPPTLGLQVPGSLILLVGGLVAFPLTRRALA